ncbi:MAG: tetratricopeptide repeat protein [Betaproteobacteria bacterium]
MLPKPFPLLAEDPPPMGPLAFLFTDIEDSTRLWQDAPEAMHASLAQHDAILRGGIEALGGRVFKTAGDAFCATFDVPQCALEAALVLQQTLLTEAWSRETPIRVRMALHVGAAQVRDGDYFGPALNVVARLLSVARGGQTLLTGAVRDLLDDACPERAEIESHGFYHLKGVEEPVEVFELGPRGSASFAPPSDTDRVYRVIRTGALWQPVRAIRHNLPAERDTFVGRAAELQAIARRLDAGARFVTVLGSGGTGKTRLVLRYGRAWLGDWPGGVYFADLSETRSLDGIFFAVASALEVSLGKDDPAMQLGHAVAGRGRCLVILDNFEQVVQHAPATLGRWLDRAANAAFVVTSRVRLHVPGEENFPLEPLPLETDAIDLFIARARAQKPDFVLGEANRAAVTEVVRLLDGLPLAIELAATRVRVLSPAQLVERMRDRFSLLAGAHGAAARQATLRAAIDWSWELLTPWEQAALAQASVFVGGFTLAAAEHVVDLSAWPEAPLAMDVVQSLVDKSLLRTWTAGVDKRLAIEEMYFGMYVSIQEYTAEKLRTEGALPSGASGASAEQAAAERHGRYFARFGTVEALDALATHGGVVRHQALMPEAENLVAACRRAVSRVDAAVAVATFAVMWAVFGSKGLFRPATEMGRQVMALEVLSPLDRGHAAYTLAATLRFEGRIDETLRYYEMALLLYREVGNHRGEARALYGLGDGRQNLGRVEEALQCWQEALPISRKVGDRRNEALCLDGLANLYNDQGRMEDALRHYQQALASTREAGNRGSECHELGNLGACYMQQGRMDEALQHFQDALAIAREASNRRVEGHVLGDLGALHLHQGRLVAASANLHDALAIALDTGNRRFETNIRRNLGDLLLHEGRPEEALGHLGQALALAREASFRRGEGEVLGRLGRLHTGLGRIGEGRQALAAGEAILRSVDAVWDLAVLLCFRGECERVAGDMPAAGRYLEEVTALVDNLSVSPHSELGREIAKLRVALDGASAAPAV